MLESLLQEVKKNFFAKNCIFLLRGKENKTSVIERTFRMQQIGLLIYFINPLQILNKLNVCLRDQFIAFLCLPASRSKSGKIVIFRRSRKAKLSNHLYFQMQADRMGRTLSRLLGTVSRSWFCRNFRSHCIRMATTFSRLISRPDQLCYLEYCAWHNGPTY